MTVFAEFWVFLLRRLFFILVHTLGRWMRCGMETKRDRMGWDEADEELLGDLHCDSLGVGNVAGRRKI